MRRDNLYRRITGTVIEMGLLETDGGALRMPEDFESVLHTAFVESGGEKTLARAREKFDRDRNDYRTKGEKANEIQIPDFFSSGRWGGRPEVRSGGHTS